MTYRKASIRELATAAYELDSGVVEGHLHRDTDSGQWAISDTELSTWLETYADKEIVLIAVPMETERSIPPRVCRTCGTDFVGVECPRCREARVRLRGR